MAYDGAKGSSIRQRASAGSAVAKDHQTRDLFEQLVQLPLRDLQNEQAHHDEGYHRDILSLSPDRRMNHMALHMAKYTGHFIAAIEADDSARYDAMLVDSFIITLASANSLNLNLGESFQTANEDASGNYGINEFQFVHHFARITGRLSKACESQDHGEEYPIHAVMVDSVIAFARLVLDEARIRGLNLMDATRRRWRAVEEKIDRKRSAQDFAR